jgi:NitT/TauT family transport system substrate-binding protein
MKTHRLHLRCVFSDVALFLSVLLCVSFLGLGCAKQRDSHVRSAPVEVRVGYQPFTSDLAIFVAIQRGYFKEQGVSPRLTMFRSTTDFLNALVSDRIDVAGIIGAPTFFARECESPGLVKLFLPAVETEQRYVAALLVPKNSPIKTIAELKGKTVGTYAGTTQALNLKYILSRFFDPEKDVKMVQVSSELQLQALASGQFDALLTIEPYTTLGVAKGIARVLEANPRCKYIMSPFPASAQVVSVAYLRKDPEAFKKYYRALRRAVAYIKASPSEAKAILPKYTELTPEVAAQSNMYEWQYDEAVNKARFQDLADLYFEHGVLSKKIDVVGMFASLDVLGIGPK